jgi:glutamate carboxypeptidase
MTIPTAQEKTVLDWLAGQRAAMLDLIADIVNIDSGSGDKAGVDAVGARLAAYLGENGIVCEFFPDATYGDGLVGRIPGEGPPILLMGHRDTVFPKGDAARRPFRIDGGRAYGPGCADMKSGLVMNAFVMAALRRFGTPAPIVGLFTSDEEIGSPSSRKLIEREAKGVKAVFNAEPGRPNGGVVTARKGGVFMTCEVFGRAAHAGNNLADGISAIEEVARKILDLHALTDFDRGITVHVGMASGGEAVNMVAPHATFTIDLRYIKPGDRASTLAAIEAIVGRSYLAGTTSKLAVSGEFMPLVVTPQSTRLFDLYADCAREIGRPVTGEFAGGCADSGFTAMVGAPTLCATGPVGGRAHSPDEYMEVDSVVTRAQTLALAILRIDRFAKE